MRKTAKGRWRVAIPLEYAKGGDVSSIGLQRRGDGNPKCASKFALGAFRVAWRDVRDSPLELRRFVPTATEGAKPVWRDGGIEHAVADNNKHWSGLHMRLVEPMDAKAAAGCGDLVFEVNSGRTPLGTLGAGRQRLRVEAIFKAEDKKKELRKTLVDKAKSDGAAIDDDPWTWQTVRIPFSSEIPPDAATLSRFGFQLLDMPQDGRSGLVFRNFRFEPAAD